MEKEFCPYEQSLSLKELGYFNNSILNNCITFYGENRETLNIELSKINCFHPGIQYKNYISFIVGAPLYQQVFRWFREKYGLFIQPNRTVGSEGIWYYFSISTKRTDVCEGSFIYEEAELECLKKLIEIVKEKK